MNLGTLIDNLYELRQQRLVLTKEVDALKAQELALRQTVLEELDSSGMLKGSGTKATCGVTYSLEPIIDDWAKIHAYIRENDRFDLLQQRLSSLAWRELLEAGFLLPGTDKFTARNLSLTKSSRN
jgi:hypothetical protein